MTIEELLKVAQDFLQKAHETSDGSVGQFQLAMIAAAHAQTAQAMILAQAMPPTSEGLMRVLQIDSGN